MSVKVMESVIKHGILELSVPEGMSVEVALANYAINYPELSVAKLGEPVEIDGKMVFEVLKNEKIGTKG